MTGTGTSGPVVTGTRFLAVAEVHAPIAETKGVTSGAILEILIRLQKSTRK